MTASTVVALLVGALLGGLFVWRWLRKKECDKALERQADRGGQVERLEYLLRTSPAVLFTVDPTDPLGATFVSEGIRQLTGYEPRDFIEMPGFWVTHIHPEDLRLIEAGVETLLERGSVTVDYRFRVKSGDYRWLRDSAVLVRDPDGEPLEIVGSWLEITEYKNAELSLRMHAEILANGTEGVNVVSLDDLRIRYVNPRFEAMFGYAPGELIGREVSLLNAVGDASAEATAQTIADGLRTAGFWRGEVLNRRKDGSTFWTFANIGMRDLPSMGRVSVSVQVDINELKEAQLRVRDSEAQLHALAARLRAVREDERGRLAREVHDVLGQLLTGLTLDLAQLRRRLGQVADDALRREMSDRLTDMGVLVEGMIRSVQEITSELRPSILDNLGLAAAIRFEAGRFEQRTEIRCLHALPDEFPRLAPETATGVFRIVQEILTNVARHAGATEVQIRLTEDGDRLELEIADNGRGLSGAEETDSASLGLVGMRERARYMGGEIRFQGSAGRGTTVRLRVPR